MKIGVQALQTLPGVLLHRLKQAGELADRSETVLYLVGGAARDALSGIATTDADLMVEGDGIAFAKRLTVLLNATCRSHLRFGTATLTFADGSKIDVAMARSEQYLAPAALPVVQPGLVKADLFRRDFTVNAIAICLNAKRYGLVVDPHGGIKDLQTGVIRILHDRSFIDDPTRLFRAVRFEQRLGFRLERHTAQLFREAIAQGMIDRLSGHRVLEQLRTVFAEKYPCQVIERLGALGVLRAVYPALDAGELVSRIFERLSTKRQEMALDSETFFVLGLLGLAVPLSAKTVQKLTERLHPDRRTVEALKNLPDMKTLTEGVVADRITTRAGFFEHARRLSPDTGLFFALTSDHPVVRTCCETYYFTDRHVRLSIDGNTLSELGIPEGPVYGRILDSVLAAKIDGVVLSADDERHRALTVWKTLETRIIAPDI
ncbi:MAG: CCA tRNA nucleotidyltransferase [candidate division Zixibacteria bacterium]|nr:CCA tRNA nucleotidyltransferase [candidate division Zixibacteria bacterium]